MIENLKAVLQDCNLNFLLGAGLSQPYLATLGGIEKLLTEVEVSALPVEKKQVIRFALYCKYFDAAISRNVDILDSAVEADETLGHYCDFLRIINGILLDRKSTLLGKEANLFTTNLDIFLEKALEKLSLEFNDGFGGRFAPTFDLGNFKKSHFKRSLQYDNVSEIPVFNLLKVHGSLTWCKMPGVRMGFSSDLSAVRRLKELRAGLPEVLAVPEGTTVETLSTAATGHKFEGWMNCFAQAYEDLLIVNPTKEKFKLTLLNHQYYELLRIFSNEMEKENTALFVLGFSFADEHLRAITLRAADSNPTLMIYIVAYSAEARQDIETNLGSQFKNRNVKIIAPTQKAQSGSLPSDEFKYTLAEISRRLFSSITDQPFPSGPSRVTMAEGEATGGNVDE
ncbi:MAG: SIR2 family protein [Nitrospirae bacterium]|nr:SIR2 family protein [Nitrospirota bacterium]